jgi:flagellin
MTAINTNYLSLVAQGNLNKSQSSLGTAIERLSSGIRINSAKDDAAGQAIANRFEANIRGLTQAARNANDGVSLAQTTEGALDEIINNLQRIRELTVQALNGTNADGDRTSAQVEIGQRLQEIDRISAQTQFNGIKVLAADKTLKIQVGANDNETISIDLKKLTAETMGLNSFNVHEQKTVTATTAIYTDSPEALDWAAVPAAVTTAAAGGATDSKLYFNTADNKSYVKVDGATDAAKNGYYEATVAADGKIALGTLAGTQPAASGLVTIEHGRQKADTTAVTGNSLVTLKDQDGNDAGYALKDASGKLFAADVDFATGKVTGKTISFTDAAGAVQKDVKVELGGIDGKTEVVSSGGKTYASKDLATQNLQTGTVAEAPAATANPLTAIDAALDQANTLRSNLGAVQNRFGSTVANLNNTVNNLSAAKSRIMDADYAVEVSNMGREQIKQQAGMSVLAQANQIPQGVLALLR